MRTTTSFHITVDWRAALSTYALNNREILTSTREYEVHSVASYCCPEKVECIPQYRSRLMKKITKQYSISMLPAFQIKQGGIILSEGFTTSTRAI